MRTHRHRTPPRAALPRPSKKGPASRAAYHVAIRRPDTQHILGSRACGAPSDNVRQCAPERPQIPELQERAMREAVIVSTARTPIGKAYRGAFNDTQAQQMGGHA